MRIIIIILLTLPFNMFAQTRSLDNFTDANGLKQGIWKVKHENSQALRYTLVLLKIISLQDYLNITIQRVSCLQL